MGWKSKGLSEESIGNLATSDNSFVLKLTYIHNSKISVKFERNRLKQEKLSFTHVVNFLVVYELDIFSRDSNDDFTLKNCLSGAVELTGRC